MHKQVKYQEEVCFVNRKDSVIVPHPHPILMAEEFRVLSPPDNVKAALINVLFDI